MGVVDHVGEQKYNDDLHHHTIHGNLTDQQVILLMTIKDKPASNFRAW